MALFEEFELPQCLIENKTNQFSANLSHPMLKCSNTSIPYWFVGREERDEKNNDDNYDVLI